jgi:hypothetical protein
VLLKLGNKYLGFDGIGPRRYVGIDLRLSF